MTYKNWYHIFLTIAIYDYAGEMDIRKRFEWVLNLVYPQTIIVFDTIDMLPLSSLLIPYVISDPVYHFIGCDRSFSREEWCEGGNTS